ncbi:PepSY domain-containing protein [Marinospirillum insulare]|uniref:NADPH flavoprotein n=1 Tax=Marinospirillum insulare TaxID=217169 RepID=A0ABQ5ZXV2_9GAMM|nr:PepSY domain-containing protein [Marinospirillum insulare]GLR62765.1 NADPH flavoprotein [Marinospirillum insulare]
MLRQLHSLPGLLAAIFVLLISVTGALLSFNPVLERATTSVPASGQISVAEFVSQLAKHYSEVEQVTRTPTGSLIVYYMQDGQVRVDQVDHYTGQAIIPYEPPAYSRWVKNLHRSLLLDTYGRALVGITALTLLLLAISGVMLLVTRLGGWRQLFRPVNGTLIQRLHTEFGRLALLGLLVSSLTGIYLSATTFNLIAEGLEAEPELMQQVVTGPAAPIETLTVLKSTDLSNLKELVYPYPNDPKGTYSLTTKQGAGYLNQTSGEWLSYQPHNVTYLLYEFIYMLHTGEGLWWFGLALGIFALAAPLLAITGVLIWWQKFRAKPRLIANSKANTAVSIILVGSENNTTWGFAKTLHNNLVKAGQSVHTAPMNQLTNQYVNAKYLFILTATYGDGDAPTSAKKFLAKLEKTSKKPSFSTSILGFGDRQFPQFCGFAKQVAAAINTKGWPELLPLETINKQSSQEFARWGNALSKKLGTQLQLNHSSVQPKTTTLVLDKKTTHGIEVQAPTAVLAFKALKNNLPYFEVGDLVGILPPNNQAPRLYSLASASKDGILEICVRQHLNGLCSNFLHQLPLGGSIKAFIQPNPKFRPVSGKTPIILIGAGTGIGPLVGFIRHNQKHRPMYLYWGGRSLNSDFLYQSELHKYLADKRLTELNAVFSRDQEQAYVQDKLSLDATKLGELIKQDAQVLVCGGRNMANSIMAAFDKILIPLNTDVAILKTQGRYREDVY